MELNLDIEQAVRELQKALDNEFSNPACAYDITFQGKRYPFEPWTTREEYEEQKKLRQECIRALLFDHVASIVDRVTINCVCENPYDDLDCTCPVLPENLIIATLKWSSYNKDEHEMKVASESYLVTPEQIKEEIHENVKMQLENDKKIDELSVHKYFEIKND